MGLMNCECECMESWTERKKRMTPRRRKRLRRRRKLYRARRRVREYCESPLGKRRLARALRKLGNRPPNLMSLSCASKDAVELEETYTRYLRLCELNGAAPRDIHSFAEAATRSPYRVVELINGAICTMNEGGK